MVSQHAWLAHAPVGAGQLLRHVQPEHVVNIPYGISPMRRLDETMAAFLARYANAETRRTYEKTLHPFAAHIGPHQALGAITPEMLDSWFQRLSQHGLANATITSRVKTVKVFWNWCVRREYIPQSPARFLVVPRCNRMLVSKAIPGDALAAMFEAVQHKPCTFLATRDTAILALLITFGARVGDVARLTLNSIHPDAGVIVFRVKGGNEHLLPLPPQTGQHLSDWLTLRTTCTPDPPHDHVFVALRTHPGQRHAPLTAGGMTTMIRRLSSQVCGQGYGPHAIRHWRGQSLADHRVAPTIVQAILGHSDVRTTLEHYYNQDWPRVQQILDTHEMMCSLKLPHPGFHAPATLINRLHSDLH